MLLPLPLLLPLLLTTTLATHSHSPYPLTTTLATHIHDPSPLTTTPGTNTRPLHPFFNPNPCAFDTKYKDQTCVPEACYADGGRCHLSIRNRCAEHQLLYGELIQRTWLYSSAPRSCRPCKCVKAYTVARVSRLGEAPMEGEQGRKRKGDGGSRRRRKGGKGEDDGEGEKRGRI